MNVILISETKPLLEKLPNATAEEFLVYTARVSNPSNQTNTMTAPKLIKYLLDHKHVSPFEMIDYTFEIETSLDIAAQILRHKSASFQQWSGRYAAMQLGYEPIDWRLQDTKNRQNSISFVEENPEQYLALTYEYSKWMEAAMEYYRKLMQLGIAREVARKILPVNMTTKLYMKNNLRNWIFYLDVRDADGVQLEHRNIAKEIKKILKEKCPNVASALSW